MNTLYCGDALSILKTLPSQSVQCCVTSPPYFGLRDYGVDGQIGLENRPEDYVASLIDVFTEVKRVLKNDGTFWLNLGDSFFGCGYSNHKINGDDWKQRMNGDKRRSRQQDLKRANPELKPKDLIGIPWRVAFALQEDGWYLRSDIIWSKPNPMPESVLDRPTKSHEYVFLLTKSARYFYNENAVKEPLAESSLQRLNQNIVSQKGSIRGNGGAKTNGTMKAVGNTNGRNLRSVWTITTKPFRGAHFATMPVELAERCIKAGSKEGDVILDPFAGAGTTGVAASKLGRSFVGIELNPQYHELATQRIEKENDQLSLFGNRSVES